MHPKSATSKCNLQPRFNVSGVDDVQTESAQILPPRRKQHHPNGAQFSLIPQKRMAKAELYLELKSGVRRETTNVRSRQAHAFINPSTTRSFLCLQRDINLQRQVLAFALNQ